MSKRDSIIDMIEIKQLNIELKKFRLKAVGIRLLNGDKVILASQNNSGKSIFMLGLTGLIRTKEREVFFDHKHCSQDEWQVVTGVYHDQSSLVPFLTPSELFKMVAELKGLSYEVCVDDILKYCEYLRFPIQERKYINELSLGTQKKAGLIASLIGKPKYVLWDEPFSNLDDDSGIGLSKLIDSELANTTILLTSPLEAIPNNKFNVRLTIKDNLVVAVGQSQ